MKKEVSELDKEKREVKIENNKVICKCGKDLGEFIEGKVYFCEVCFMSIGFKNIYTSISFEEVFGNQIEESEEDERKKRLKEYMRMGLLILRN